MAWFCCLGWVANKQQPAVLLMTEGCIQVRMNQQNVKCHLLSSPFQLVCNDFTNTVVEKQAVCNRLAENCNCAKLHATNFPIQHILVVAVVKGSNNLHKNLFCKYTPSPPNTQTNLIHMSMSKESEACFSNYSDRRLKFFNDFFLLPNN